MRISYSLTALANAISAILIAAGTNVTKWAGSNVAAVNVAGYPLVDTHYHRGTVENVLIANRRDVNVGAMQAAVLTGQLVKSIQIASGTITAGNTVGTINYTTVNASRSFPIFLGCSTSAADNQSAQGKVDSFGASSAGISRGGTTDAATVTIAVVELY